MHVPKCEYCGRNVHKPEHVSWAAWYEKGAYHCNKKCYNLAKTSMSYSLRRGYLGYYLYTNGIRQEDFRMEMLRYYDGASRYFVTQLCHKGLAPGGYVVDAEKIAMCVGAATDDAVKTVERVEPIPEHIALITGATVDDMLGYRHDDFDYRMVFRQGNRGKVWGEGEGLAAALDFHGVTIEKMCRLVDNDLRRYRNGTRKQSKLRQNDTKLAKAIYDDLGDDWEDIMHKFYEKNAWPGALVASKIGMWMDQFGEEMDWRRLLRPIEDWTPGIKKQAIRYGRGKVG